VAVFGGFQHEVFTPQGGNVVVKFVEIVKLGNDIGSRSDYMLREVFVNPKQVTMLRENSVMKNLLREGRLPSELDDRIEFTRIYLNTNIDLNVVGSPVVVESKLNTKQLLRG